MYFDSQGKLLQSYSNAIFGSAGATVSPTFPAPSRMIGLETLTLAGGAFSTLKFSGTSTDATSSSTFTQWVARGLGIIKVASLNTAVSTSSASTTAATQSFDLDLVSIAPG